MTDVPEISGPRREPPAGVAVEQLVVLVHGYGADGADLIALAPEWAGLLPNAAFVAPNGPEPCEMAAMAYQWFALTDFSAGEREAGVRGAAPVLDHFISGELARYGLGEDRLALVGFSQGTMLSLWVAAHRARPCAAVVGYSGMIAGAETLSREIVSRPPVMLIHGSADQLIPVAALAQAVEFLGANGFSVSFHVSQGAGHTIAPDGRDLGGRFLAEKFAARAEQGASP